MNKFSLFAVAALVMVSGCGKDPAPANNAATAAETTVIDDTQPSAIASGVPECDEYLTKVMACIKDKVPAEQRAAMEQAIEQSKASWASVSDKTQLAATCKSAMDQAKAAYGAMGCTF